MENERRNINGSQRKKRVAAGGVAVPISIVISSFINHQYGDSMGPDFTIAMTSIVSSVVSVLTICFWDLRGIVLSRLFRRRRCKP